MGAGREINEWRDVAALVSGPAARQMQLAFAGSWRASGGSPLDPDDFPELAPAGDVPAAYVESHAGPRNAALKLSHLLTETATRRLWITNSWFIPSDELIARFAAKAQQGVDVRVMVPGHRHDRSSILAAQRSSYPGLKASGVRIFEYAPAMLHSKVMLIDDRISVIGSVNLDPFSLEQLDEGALVVVSAEVAHQLEQDFREDMRWSVEVHQAPQASLFQRMYRSLFWFLGRNL